MKLNFDGDGSYEGNVTKRWLMVKEKEFGQMAVSRREFNMGEQHGQGKHHFANGDVYEGEYDRGAAWSRKIPFRRRWVV